MTDGPDTTLLQVFPIAIGAYLNHADLPVEAEVARIVALLAEFGGYPVHWNVPMDRRGRDAIDARLHDWTTPAEPHNTVLYWLGHGESTGDRAALAHWRSPASFADSGLTAEAMATVILRRQGPAQIDEPWALVIIDACQSARFVQLLNAEISRDLQGARRVLLVGTSGEGSAWLGRFSAALDTCLRHTFHTNQQIELWDLAKQLERMLPDGEIVVKHVGGAALVRRVPVAAEAGLSMPLDVLAEIEAVLAELTEDERRHFVPKAQSAEVGELTWHFEGRARERQLILDWLRERSTGLLVVTGAAGTGKSALLGHIVVHSRPELRRLLVGHGLVEPLPQPELPPDNVFDAAIHLTGMTTADVVLAIIRAAGFRSGQPLVSVNTVLNTLINALLHRDRPLTLLIDALDEAQDPLTVASVLSRLVGINRVRLVVGTRRSTTEGPDLPDPRGDDLLRALGAESADVFTVVRDPDAITRFVRRRLALGAPSAADDQIDNAARAIAKQGREFLFARLAVYELIARPDLFSGTGDTRELDRLLDTDHRGLFETAIDRLRAQRMEHAVLLEALALARGRGLPIKDGIWGRVASALVDLSAGVQHSLGDDDIAAVLKNAAPYVMLDAEDGQSVYRLSHRTFVEAFRANRLHEWPRKIAIVGAALLTDAASHDEPLNPYLARHLSGHLVASDTGWDDLARNPGVLDRLDPQAVAADAMRSVFSGRKLPAAIAGVIRARQVLRAAAPEDRLGLRLIAMARQWEQMYQFLPPSNTHAAWYVRFAALRRHPLHLTMTGHTGAVNAVVAFTAPDGRTILATGSDDGTLRLWDPASGTQVGDPLGSGSSQVACLTVFPSDDGRARLASCGRDETTVRLWDPDSRTVTRELVTDHTAPVLVVAAVPWGDKRSMLATGSADQTVRLWDPATGAAVGDPLTGLGHAVMALTSFTDFTGQTLLAVAGRNGSVLLWDTRTGRTVRNIDGGREGRIASLAVFPGDDGQLLLATGGWNRTVRVRSLSTNQVDDQVIGRAGPVSDLVAFRGNNGWTIAAASADGKLWLWDGIIETRLNGHSGPLNAVSMVPGNYGRTLLATGSDDRTVRVWDPSEGTQPGGRSVPVPKHVTGVVSLPRSYSRRWFIAGIDHSSELAYGPYGPGYLESAHAIQFGGSITAAATFHDTDGNPRLATAGTNGTVEVWDPDTRTQIGAALTGGGSRVTGMVVFPGRDGHPKLATVGADRLVQTWDLHTRARADFAHKGHQRRVTAITTFTEADRMLLATGGDDGAIRVWDPHTGTLIRELLISPNIAADSFLAFDVLTGPDGKPLLAAAIHGDNDVWIVDLRGHTRLRQPLASHTRPVTAITTMRHNDRTLLASGAQDETVRLWDPIRRVLLRTIPVGFQIRALAANDDELAIAGDADFLVLTMQ